LIKLVRKTVHITPADLQRSKELVKFYVYDGYGFNRLTEKTPYTIRKNWINQYVTGIYNCVASVPEFNVRSVEELNERYNSIINEGHEGIILRHKEMAYEHKRSRNLLKFKPTDSDEYVIMDILEGNGNWAGKAKIITVKMPCGKIFDATFKGSMENAITCLKDKNKWIGKTVTINYYGFTGLGTPNYAQFDYANCMPSTGVKALPNT
jgi:DNA ligase-1